MQINLTEISEHTGMVMAKMPHITKEALPKVDFNLHLRTEKADSKYVNDPSTT